MNNKNITCKPFLKLYSRDLIEQVTFPEEINYSEDMFFVFHVLQRCKRVVYGTKVLYLYVQNDTSATHNYNFDKLFVSWKMIQKEVLKYVAERHELLAAAYSRLFVFAVFYGSVIGKDSSQTAFRKELLDAIRQYGIVTVKDNNSKKLHRSMAVIGCINTRLLVSLCRLNIVLRRKFRVAVRRSV